jgi:predicted nucleic acid-binding protein
MAQATPIKPRVFIDADVLIAGGAYPTEHGASLLILRLAEITLLDGFTSEQVVAEVERNLEMKFPGALPAFHHLLSRCIQVLSDPEPGNLHNYKGLADPKDLPILVAAVEKGCPWLVTFNTRHFRPGHPDVVVLTPGDFILRIRHQLAGLA